MYLYSRILLPPIYLVFISIYRHKLHYATLHYTTLHYITLRYTTSHHITTQHNTSHYTHMHIWASRMRLEVSSLMGWGRLGDHPAEASGVLTTL